MKNKIYEGLKLNNFRELVSLYKEKYKDNIAFEFRKLSTDLSTIKLTYSRFAQDIENLGTALLEIKAKRIAIISPNRYEWCVAYLAATTAGLVVIPLDKSLPGNEIEGLIDRSEADTIFYDIKYEPYIKKCQNKIRFDSTFIDVIQSNSDFKLKFSNISTSYSSLISFGKNTDHNNYNNIIIDNSKMSVMLFTSGTTSISKAVMLSQNQICTTLYGLSQMIFLDSRDKFLSFLPLHHTYESSCTFLFGTQCGISIIFCDGLKYISKNLVEFHVTGFVCVPLMLEIMYKKLVKEIDKQHKTLIVNVMKKIFRHSSIETKRKIFKSIIDGFGGQLKTIITGGAAMDKLTLQGYNDLGFDIHQGYGLTETAGPIAGENSFTKRLGSVGFPLPTVNIKVDCPDNDGIGELLIDSPSTMFGYYQNEKATSEVFSGHWFHSGDLGYVDKDGFVFITGRKKDMIVLKNGKKVFPEELEALINKLPYVAESIVFGKIDDTKKDRNSDTILCAKIVLKPDEIKKSFPNILSQENDYSKYYDVIMGDIKDRINKQMPAYKYIRHIIITDKPLIKTTTLKIKRNEEMKKQED